MREKSYMMNSNFSTKNSNMPRRRIFMNTCIPIKRRNQSKNNANLGTKKTTMTTMIMKNTKTIRNSGMRYLTGSSLQTL